MKISGLQVHPKGCFFHFSDTQWLTRVFLGKVYSPIGFYTETSNPSKMFSLSIRRRYLLKTCITAVVLEQTQVALTNSNFLTLKGLFTFWDTGCRIMVVQSHSELRKRFQTHTCISWRKCLQRLWFTLYSPLLTCYIVWLFVPSPSGLP